MAYKYQIKKGGEKRVFANARNLGNGIVESDEPLESSWLTLVNEKTPADETKPAAPVAAPVAPQAPAVPAAPVAPAAPAKEAN